MDIDLELEKIVADFASVTKVRNLCSEIYDTIVKNLRDLQGKRVIIRGGGFHTTRIFDFLEKENISLDIIAIVDNKLAGRKFKEIDIIDKYSIDNFEGRYDTVLVSSYKYRKEMTDEFRTIQGIEIIDIYDVLEKMGIPIHVPYYYYKEQSYEIPIFFIKEYRKNATKDNLLNVIMSLIDIKDFESAFSYIDLFIENGFDNDNSIKELKSNLEKMFSDIKMEFDKRKNKNDIVAFVLDSVPYKNIEWLPNINSKRQKTLFFKNAYTTCPYTTQSIRSFLNRELHIDDYDFFSKDEKFSIENCEFLKYLKEKNYEFKYISMMGNGLNLFNQKNMNDKEFDEESSGCEIIWEGIKQILLTDKPIVCFIHTICETHNPNTSIYNADFEWNTYSLKDIIKNNQHKKSYEYIDKVISFYSSMIQYGTKIYMSDHGEHYNDPEYHFADNKIHAMCMVESSRIEPREIDGMFSWIDFPELIKYIIESDEKYLFNAIKDYALFQDIDFYNEFWVNNLCADGLQEYGMSFRGVTTQKDKYVLLGNGKEIYCMLKDENKNLINEDKYALRISELREIAGNFFVDTSKYKELKHCKKLYI